MNHLKTPISRPIALLKLLLPLILTLPQHSIADGDIKKEEVPAVVHDAFKVAYPKAHNIDYDLEHDDGKTVYEITFREGKRKIQVHYLDDGTLIRVEKHNMDDDDD